MGLIENANKAFADFRNKAGSYVFWASIITKLFTFLASWIALQMVPEKSLGFAIYAFTIVAFLIPFAGAGLFQSLLRFGARLESEQEQQKMYSYCLRYGLLGSAVLALILVIFAEPIAAKLPESAEYLQFFSLMMFSSFLFELSKVYHRVVNDNRMFAFSDMFYAIILAVSMFSFTSSWGAHGYALAFVLSPLFAAIFAMSKLPGWGFRGKAGLGEVEPKKFWMYGVFSSLGNVTTELLIAIDIILIGNLMLNSTEVTAYKYVTILPFSLLFLSHVYMSTHFVSLAKRMEERDYIRNFIKNYLIIFAGIIAGILVGSYVLGEWLLSIFSEDYRQYFDVLMILVTGTAGVLLLRGLFGNLISAIGKAQANFGISALALILNVILNYQLIPKHGIRGAAMTSTVVMWFTALLSVVVFYFYFNRQKEAAI